MNSLLTTLSHPSNHDRSPSWRRFTSTTLLLCVSFVGGSVWAQQRPPMGERRGPPPEMIEACVGKAAGAACSAVGPQGRQVNGTCFAPPDMANARLACRPAGGPGGNDPQNPPPPDASPQQRGAVISATQANTAAIGCGLRGNTQNAGLRMASTFSWVCANGLRSLSGNGIPNHVAGAFPNAANPNKISSQKVQFAVTLTPAARQGEAARIKESGMAVNGIKFDPGTGGSCPSTIASRADCSMDRGPGQWRMEALGQSSFNFGVDTNNAHVQPDGSYHYHGLPTGLLSAQVQAGKSMQLIGWAADGFPMYAMYGYSEPRSAKSALRKMRGSYRVKTSPDVGRPSPAMVPMGTFQQDYEFVSGSGDLDECNGRFAVTPEFPNGIYHYYVTDSYPYVQRCVKGTPNQQSNSGPGPNQGGRPGQP
jgi:hypothetical protein